MKKSLSLVLALLVVLSALSIPALAADEAAAELPLVKDVAGSTVAMDGEMGADEGWAEVPYMLLDTVWTGSAQAAVVGEVYAGYDTEYLYLFVHTTVDTTVLRVLLSFDGKNEKTAGQWICSCFYTNTGTNGRSSGMVPGSSQQLDIYSEFYTMYAQGSPDHELWQKTAWYGAGTNGLERFEMKIPMTAELEAGIAAGTVKLGVSVNDSYTASEGFGWSSARVPLTFEAPLAFPRVVGVQTRDRGETYDVRFAAVVRGLTLEEASAGFRLAHNGKEVEVSCNYVYEELAYTDGESGGTYRAADFGGDYFICYTVCGLSKGSAAEPVTYSFEATAFTVADAGGERQESTAMAVSVTCDAESGETTVIAEEAAEVKKKEEQS